MSFFSSLFAELAARRARLRAAFGDPAGTWIEFAFLSGIVMGVIAAVLMDEPRGWGPLIALIPGYLLLDLTRQQALARGANEEAVRKRQDRLVFALFAALALIGAAFCVYAMQQPRRLQVDQPSTGKQFDVDIVSPPS